MVEPLTGLIDFDHGAGLLADTTMDYPMEEELYVENLRFHFSKQDITRLLAGDNIYHQEMKSRMESILLSQLK